MSKAIPEDVLIAKIDSTFIGIIIGFVAGVFVTLAVLDFVFSEAVPLEHVSGNIYVWNGCQYTYSKEAIISPLLGEDGSQICSK